MNLRIVNLVCMAAVTLIFAAGSVLNIIRSLRIGDNVCIAFFALTLSISLLMVAIIINESRKGGAL